MSALSMVCRMRPHSASLNIIARELALDIADSMYEPQIASHIPGVSNVIADILSRKFAPAAKQEYKVPSLLAECAEIHPPERNSAWWRSLKGPPPKARG